MSHNNLAPEATAEEIRAALIILADKRSRFRVRVLTETNPKWDTEQLEIIESRISELKQRLVDLLKD